MPKVFKALNRVPHQYYVRNMNKLRDYEDVMDDESLMHFVKGMVAFSGLTEDRALHWAAIEGNYDSLLKIIKSLQLIYDKTNPEPKSMHELVKSVSKLNNTALNKAERMQIARITPTGKNALVVDVNDPKSLSAYQDLMQFKQRTSKELELDHTKMSQKFLQTLNQPNALGETFLSILIKNGHYFTIEKLLRGGLPIQCLESSLSRQNHLQQTLLMLNCVDGPQNDGDSFIEAILRQGGVSQYHTDRSQTEVSLLTTASSNRLATSLKARLEYFIKHGAPIDRPDCYGAILLHYVAANGDEESITFIIKILQERKLLQNFLNRKTKSGHTPLHWAVLNNNAVTLKILLNCKADPMIQNNKKESALLLACQFSSDEVVDVFELYYSKQMKTLQDIGKRNKELIPKIKAFVKPMARGVIIIDSDFTNFIINIKTQLHMGLFPKISPELKQLKAVSGCLVSDRVVYEQVLKEYIIKMVKESTGAESNLDIPSVTTKLQEYFPNSMKDILPIIFSYLQQGNDNRSDQLLQDQFFLATYKTANNYFWIQGYCPQSENIIERIKNIRKHWQFYIGLQGEKKLIPHIKEMKHPISASNEPCMIQVLDAIMLLDLLEPHPFDNIITDAIHSREILELAYLNPIISFNSADDNADNADKRRSFLPFKTTLLHFAIMRNNIPAIQIITQNKANFDVQDGWNRSPLSVAVVHQHKEIVQFLIPHYNTAAKGHYGKNVLHEAMEVYSPDSIDILKMLLEKFQDVINDKDVLGFTPLSWAAVMGNLAGAKLLCDEGASLEAVTSTGDTPLLLASINEHKEVVEYLMAQGANPNTTNHYGFSPNMAASFLKRRKAIFPHIIPLSELYQGFTLRGRILIAAHLQAAYLSTSEHVFNSRLIEGVDPSCGLKNYAFISSLTYSAIFDILDNHYHVLKHDNIFLTSKVQTRNKRLHGIRKRVLQELIQQSPEFILQKERDLLACFIPKKAIVVEVPAATTAMLIAPSRPSNKIKEEEVIHRKYQTDRPLTFKFQGGSLNIASLISPNTAETVKLDFIFLAQHFMENIIQTSLLKNEYQVLQGEFGQLVPQRLFLTAEQQYLTAFFENIFKEHARQSGKFLTRENLDGLIQIRELLVKSNHFIYSADNITAYSKTFNALLNEIMTLQENIHKLNANINNTDEIRLLNLKLFKILHNKDIVELTKNLDELVNKTHLSKAKGIKDILQWISFGQELYLGFRSENRFAALSLIEHSIQIKALWHSSLSKAVVDLERVLQMSAQHLSDAPIFKRTSIQRTLEKIRGHRNSLAHGEELSEQELRFSLDVIDEFNQFLPIFNFQEQHSRVQKMEPAAQTTYSAGKVLTNVDKKNAAKK